MEGFEYYCSPNQSQTPPIGRHREVPRVNMSCAKDDPRMGLTPRAIQMIYDKVQNANQRYDSYWYIPSSNGFHNLSLLAISQE